MGQFSLFALYFLSMLLLGWNLPHAHTLRPILTMAVYVAGFWTLYYAAILVYQPADLELWRTIGNVGHVGTIGLLVAMGLTLPELIARKL